MGIMDGGHYLGYMFVVKLSCTGVQEVRSFDVTVSKITVYTKMPFARAHGWVNHQCRYSTWFRN